MSYIPVLENLEEPHCACTPGRECSDCAWLADVSAPEATR